MKLYYLKVFYKFSLMGKMVYQKQLQFGLLVLFMFALSGCQNKGRSYSISVDQKNIEPGKTLYLQAYQGKKLITVDSAKICENEMATFSGSHCLSEGMYAITLQQKAVINFLISNQKSQNFTIKFDAANSFSTLEFVNSPENQSYTEFLRLLVTKNSADVLKQKGNELQKQFSGSMLALIIRTLQEPEIPPVPYCVKNYNEYAQHYVILHFFDNLDFSDKRLLNTPFLEQKLGFYFMKLVAHQTDSIIEKVKMVLDKAKVSDEVYRWTVRYLYKLYQEAPVDGNTEVYNFIGEHYIIAEPNKWSDQQFIEEVTNRLTKSKMNPVGKTATNLKLTKPDGKITDLYSIKAPITILLFYNPECEACQSVTETLLAIYREYSGKGLEIFAVYVDKQKNEWLKYIQEKKLGWINVFDPTGAEAVEKKYDIYAIPMIYILNENKKIIQKDVPIETLKNKIDQLFEKL